MPIQRCKKNGKLGWRWGRSGKCYAGPGALAKARRQEQAVQASGWTENQRRSNPLRFDPTRTTLLRKRFEAAVLQRLAKLKRDIRLLVIEEDAFGLTPGMQFNQLAANQRWRFHTSPQKVEAFQQWLRTKAELEVAGGSSDRAYWRAYIEDGYRKGAGRAFDDTKAAERAAREWTAEEAKFHQGTREEFLRSSFGRPVSIDKINLLAQRTYTDLKNVTEVMATQMSRTLTDGLVQGKNPRQIGRELNAAVDGIGRQRGQMIARTEVIRAHSSGQLDALEQLGVTEVGVMVEWTATPDERTCEECSSMEGTVLTIREAQGLIPRHVFCLSGDSILNASGVRAVTSARYTGEVLRVSTESGRSITTTKNHIFLSEHGFIPAYLLHKGMNLLGASPSYSPTGLVEYNDCGQTAIGDIFKTLAAFSRAEMRHPTTVDFHGDGDRLDSEISIVRADCVLWDKLQAHFDGVTEESLFPLVDFACFRGGDLPSVSPLAKFLERIARTFDGSMGRCRDSLALLLGRLLHPGEHGLRAIPRTQPLLFKSPNDDPSATVEMLRDSLNAHPMLKHLGNLVDWNDCSVYPASAFHFDPRSLQSPPNSFQFDSHSDRDAVTRVAAGIKAIDLVNDQSLFELAASTQTNFGFQQSVPDYPATRAESFAERFHARAPIIFPDKIVDIENRHVINLPVYDVDTQPSLIIANGLLVSQCRCAWIPANVGESIKGQVRGKERIQAAIDRSISREIPKREIGKRTLAEQKSLTRWGGADKTIAKTRPTPAVEPRKGPGKIGVKTRPSPPLAEAIPKPLRLPVEVPPKRVTPPTKQLRKSAISPATKAERKTELLQKQLAEQRARTIAASKKLEQVKATTATTEKRLRQTTAKVAARDNEVAKLKAEVKAKEAEIRAINKKLKAQDIAHDEELRRLGITGFLQ